MHGLVVNKQKSFFIVEHDGTLYTCKPSGNLIKSKKHIFVGDHVGIDVDNKLINSLLPRKNFLIRPPIANVDYVLIVMSFVEPLFSLFLVEKFLSYANFAEVKPVVIITKVDKAKETDALNEILESLKKLEVTTFIVNNKTGEGVNDVSDFCAGHVVALMGQSGVGKSSFINALTSSKRAVGTYATNINRGRHVTKEVIMLPFNDTYIVDTPGFSSFDLPLTKGDFAENFPGFKKYLGKCKFNNCLHISERDCYIKTLVNDGLISPQSYDNYVIISEELKTNREDY